MQLDSRTRLISLDAFRGFTIAGMILVNNPGSRNHIFPPFQHAEWHGLTPTDLVFPFFLFIMGVSIPLAFSKRIKAGASFKELRKKIIERSVKIFLLGLFLNLFPKFDFSNIRWPGVLQRIAIVYLASAFLYLKIPKKGLIYTGVFLLTGYWLAMTLIPVPGYGANLEPGTNLAAWLDSLLIPGRMWKGTWDPEGILSTLPAIVSGISGVLAGIALLMDVPRERQAIWLFVAGFSAFLAGAVWAWFFPLNKNLWTSSYVLYTSGLASMSLGLFMWVIDLKGIKNWTRFGVIYGSNAISIYVFAGMLPSLTGLRWEGGESMKSMFFRQLTAIHVHPQFASFMWALLFCLICFIPAYILYRKKIFIKV